MRLYSIFIYFLHIYCTLYTKILSSKFTFKIINLGIFNELLPNRQSAGILRKVSEKVKISVNNYNDEKSSIFFHTK